MKLVRLLDLLDPHLTFAVQHKEEVMTPVGVVAPRDRTQRRRSKVSPVETRNAGRRDEDDLAKGERRRALLY